MSTQLFGRMLAICLCLVSSTASAESMLQFKFKKGGVQKQKLTTITTTSMKITGQPMIKTHSNQVMDVEIICDEVSAEGVASLRQRVNRVRATQEMMSPQKQKLEYDTDLAAPTNPMLTPLDQQMRPLIGVDVTMKCDSLGRRSQVALPPKALKGGNDSPADARGSDLSTEDGLKNIIEQATMRFPDQQLKPGDSWTTTTQIKDPGLTAEVRHDYTYVGSDRKSGLEKIEVKVKTVLEQDPNSDTGVTITTKSNSGSGVVLFDKERGRIATMRVKSTTELEIVAGAQTIEQTVETEALIEDVSEE